MTEALPKNKDDDEHVVWGYIVCVRDVDDHLDEISCFAWLNPNNDDNTTIKIQAPAGMFQLRDRIEIAFRLDDRKNDKEGE
tara:strand:+ start:2020 stop:2262 length:243 start_codon:yes stop_codon:yes gene_type:complete